MKISRWAVALAPVVAAGLLTTAQAPTASAATFTAELVARNSQKCVSVEGASTQNGAAAVQWDCLDAPNQQWKLVATSAGYYTVSAVNSGKCLSISGASVQNGATAVQWDCVNASNQEWRLVQKDSGYFSIEARHSGKCLSVIGQSTANGAALVQWDCVEYANQHFRLD
ncbi:MULTISPECIES: RICIN domain-containing protein [unclassified Streptomyces]|uniref:RICIN domain-containing protein n=1 Tax=unclassified Streptomyces TaxID=2593676 RepID=UPI002250AE77|nr:MULTISPECIES: RICIN domain-containing protein [unclassified Streptomyces]WSP53698.1 RICIN domain-containing protein [Streptomyces sp. NBC_01241]WSU25634.1 RICIN domain-containing protein [Streptomyces sp. NBC_01108]MCX4785097.1 RICIN domain-containing protein [Streptomyces sp. NBC_01221]MCX4798960.1 RICIN domain-containing protein [Streptomyces sp. NBC_01242]WSJ40159.1 RICIN domain-containing protein [Streptomyces sp. NBC_01321]